MPQVEASLVQVALGLLHEGLGRAPSVLIHATPSEWPSPISIRGGQLTYLQHESMGSVDACGVPA